ETLQVVFIFGTNCPYSQASIPAWTRIAADSEVRGISAHAVSIDDVDTTRAYALENQLSFSVLSFPSNRLAQLYRAVTVPQLAVLDSDGMVLYWRPGVLPIDGAAVDSVMSVLQQRS